MNAKIALLDIDLKKHRMQMGVEVMLVIAFLSAWDGNTQCGLQVLVNDPKEMEAIRKREMDITKERIQKILSAGANVILTTKVCTCFDVSFIRSSH